MDILFPTLIIAALNDESNVVIIKKELSPSLLSQYLRSLSDSPALPSSKHTDAFTHRALLQNRLPKERWQDALEWLQQ
jgi:hypothetical protein